MDDAWQLSQQTSPMDGEVVRATRIYAFPDMGTSVRAEFVCAVEKKQLDMKLTSIVGDADNPSSASLFQRDVVPGGQVIAGMQVGPGLNVKGRIKFASLPPQDLSSYFGFSNNFGNVLTSMSLIKTDKNFLQVMVFENYLEDYLVQNDLNSVRIKSVEREESEHEDFDFNPTAALSTLFPIAIEAINGRGTFDLVIAKSKSISAVLDQCGGDGPVMDPALSQLLKSGTGIAGSVNAIAPQGAAITTGDRVPTSDAVAVETASASQASANSSSSSKSAVAPASAQIPNSAVESSMSGAADRSVTGTGNPQSLLRTSFDCTKASSPTERAICSDASLSDLDGRMAAAYKRLLSRDPLALSEQRDWMKQRNQCGGDIGCLTSSYQGRLQKIQEIMATINK